MASGAGEENFLSELVQIDRPPLQCRILRAADTRPLWHALIFITREFRRPNRIPTDYVMSLIAEFQREIG